MDLLSVPDLFADSCDLFDDVTTPLQPMHRLAPPLIDHRLPDLTFIALQDRVKVCGITGLTECEKDLYRHALISAKRADAATIDAGDPTPALAPAPMLTLPRYQSGGSAKVFAAVVSDSPPPEAASTIAQVMSRLLDRQLEVRLLRSEVGQAPFTNIVDRATIIEVTDDDRAVSVARLLHPAAHMLPKQSLRMIAAAARQLFGPSIDTPVDFLLVWTRDECSQAAKRTRETGFAGDAIALASLSGIPIVNLASDDHSPALRHLLVQPARTHLNSAQVPMN